MAFESHRVGIDDDGTRLDACLASLNELLTRSQAARAIEAGEVSVNGVTVLSKSHRVRVNDVVEFEAPDATATQDVSVVAQNIPLDIRYEDDWVIVLSKQRGLVCHPSVGHESYTLANALVAHCGIENLGTVQGEDRPGIVHRLDMDTTGLMLAAKDDATQIALQEAIRARSVDRRYVTLVHGHIAMDSGLIDAPIARSTRDRLKMCVSDDPSARPSVTTFNVLERFEAGRSDEGYTLLECKLFTGRTHQIRVHMAYIRHPVVGDQLYGKGSDAVNLDLDRQFLHSWSLDFNHPVTGERLSFLDAPTWELRDALLELSDRSMGTTERGDEVERKLEVARVLQENGW